jgi:RNA polymerase sigma-70 factor (ECF subfamily)
MEPSAEIGAGAKHFATLVERARGGDPDAFGELCDANLRHRWLVAVTVAFPVHLRAKLDPLDVLQEALQRAWSRIETFKGDDRLAWHRWMMGILRHQVLDSVRHYRKQRRNVGREKPEYSLSDATAHQISWTPSRSVALREQHLRVAEILEDLSDAHRDVIVQRVLEGRSTAEVAELTGRSADNVRITLHRALKRLHTILETKGLESTFFRPL